MRTHSFIPLAVILLAGAMPCAAAPGGSAAAGSQALGRGARVEIQNPNGSVVVTGEDSDELHVVGVDEDSGEAADVSVQRDDRAGTVTIGPSRHGGSVRFEVRLPRDANLPSIDASSGDVTVTGVHGDVRVNASSGNVRVADAAEVYVRASSGDVVVENATGTAYVESSSGDVRVSGVKGALRVKANSGDATLENVGGLLEASLGSGDVTVKNAGSGVRLDAISGEIRVDGAGSLQVRAASGTVVVSRVTGDCEVRTASGDVSFTGEISPEHTYRIRSLSGNASMYLCGNVPGFTVTLRSYSGDIETDFPLKVDNPSLVSRGLTGRFGDGKTDIQIEAVSGSAKILKCSGGASARVKKN